MSAGWHTGNAYDDGAERRGWLVGAFMPEGDIRATDAVEIKWATHPAGDQRAEWTKDDTRTTIVVLISGGTFEVQLTGGVAGLVEPGDYVMWGPGVDHAWRAAKHSVVLTVRW